MLYNFFPVTSESQKAINYVLIDAVILAVSSSLSPQKSIFFIIQYFPSSPQHIYRASSLKLIRQFDIDGCEWFFMFRGFDRILK